MSGLTHLQRQPVYLIVNADDYGYFSCVSRGILDAGRDGIVTATGVFANSPLLDEHLSWLSSHDRLDLGVHLNVTYGTPMSVAMAKILERYGGRFPGKFSMIRGMLTGFIRSEDVKSEWRAQIECLLGKGLPLRFLNSHEHIHMFPPLFRLLQDLAVEYDVPHIRHPTSEWSQRFEPGKIVRDVAMVMLGQVNRYCRKTVAPRFLGMSESGKLSIHYLQTRLSGLKRGQVYELMCHPGHYDPVEITSPHLSSYHDWEGELSLLTNARTWALLREHDIELIGYRDLVVVGGCLTVRSSEG